MDEPPAFLEPNVGRTAVRVVVVVAAVSGGGGSGGGGGGGGGGGVGVDSCAFGATRKLLVVLALLLVV